MSENAQDLTEALHNNGFELSGGTGKACDLDHKELKFAVPLESVGTIARYLELGAPLCGPVDDVIADFSYRRFNQDVLTNKYTNRTVWSSRFICVKV